MVAHPLSDYSAPCWAWLDTVDLEEEFALDCPTLRFVPGGARTAAADATEDLCRTVLGAPKGTLHEERAWKLLLLRERLLFAAPLRLEHGRRSRDGAARLDLAALVRGRVGALRRGEWAELLEEARETGRKLVRSRARGGAPPQTDATLADAVVRKVLSEEYSRAAALLASPCLAPLTTETAEALQQLLHPHARAELAPGGRPGAGPALFSKKTSKQALRNSPKGSGAAVGGGRFEHWRVVLAKPSALSALHEVLLLVASGDLPESAVAALALSKLTPLKKPGGGGVRPIAAPAVLRRLAGKALVNPRTKELAEAMGGHQFAIGTAAGAELLAHTTRACCEADPELVLTALDAKNAYCSANRADCLNELEALAPDLAAFARLFSQRRSRYFFWDATGTVHRLTATDGVDQGDPLAPLLFACGLKPRLRRLEEALVEKARAQGLAPHRVRVFAYLDDVAVLTPPELAAEVWPTALRILGELGLDPNEAKTQVWSAAAPCPPGLEEQWCPRGVTLVGVALSSELPESGLPDHSDGRRVDLGTSDYATQRCAEVAARGAALAHRLAELPTHASPHLPAVQAAGLLLRLCGSGKLTHALRTTPPSCSREAARRFDEATLESYEALASLDPLTDQQKAQCRLPPRLGGRGLRSQEQAAPAAWLGSWAQNLAAVTERSGVDSLEDLGSCELPLAVACRDALAALPPAPADGSDDTSLPPWRELALKPRKKNPKNAQ